MADIVHGEGKSVWILPNEQDAALRFILYDLGSRVDFSTLPPNIAKSLSELAKTVRGY